MNKEMQTNPWNYYKHKHGNENDLLGITLHTHLPTTRYIDR